MMATIMTVIPGFLIGALAVQVRQDLDVGEAVYGWAFGSFFLAAMIGSIVLGKVAQNIGPRRQIVGALVVSSIASAIIALAASSFAVLVGALAISGLANSGNQSAVNLLLTQAKLPRLGMAIALKQSGMPLAALLGGLSVPAIATTIGWEWGYGICALGALATAAVVWLKAPTEVSSRKRQRAEPTTPKQALLIASVGFGCLAAAAGSLNAWLVSSAHEHAGIADRPAGLLLSLGAGFGVAVRLAIGTRLDAMTRSPFTFAAALSSVGAVGVLLLAIPSQGITVAATVIAFGSGWVWPVLTNFGIVRANAHAAAAATGLTQTGVYIGVFAGPLLSGYLIDWFGYGPMWIVIAAIMVVGAVVVARTSSSIDTGRSARDASVWGAASPTV